MRRDASDDPTEVASVGLGALWATASLVSMAIGFLTTEKSIAGASNAILLALAIAAVAPILAGFVHRSVWVGIGTFVWTCLGAVVICAL